MNGQPDLPLIYLVDGDPSDGFVYGNISDSYYEVVDCPQCLQRWMKEPGLLNTIELFSADTDLGVFVWLDSPELVVPEYVSGALRKSHLIGFHARSIQQSYGHVRSPQEIPSMPSFYQLVITGIASEAGMEIIELCKYCGRRKPAHPYDDEWVIDPASWDGADIFQLPVYGGSFITQRFADILSEFENGNYQLLPAHWSK